jgi:hypothetical protein
MTRFYFDWRDNEEFFEDDEGMDLPGLNEAKVEACRSLIERARDVMPGADRHSLSIEVRDRLRRPVLTITLILEVRPIDS